MKRLEAIVLLILPLLMVGCGASSYEDDAPEEVDDPVELEGTDAVFPGVHENALTYTWTGTGGADKVCIHSTYSISKGTHNWLCSSNSAAEVDVTGYDSVTLDIQKGNDTVVIRGSTSPLKGCSCSCQTDSLLRHGDRSGGECGQHAHRLRPRSLVGSDCDDLEVAGQRHGQDLRWREHDLRLRG